MMGVEEEGRETMAKQFACKDIGMNCGFKTEANNEEELMVKIAQHAKEVHNMSQIDSAARKRSAQHESNLTRSLTEGQGCHQGKETLVLKRTTSSRMTS